NEVKNRMAHFGNEHKSELKEEIVQRLIELLDNNNALVQLFRTARNKCMDADIPEFKVGLYNVIGTRQYELPTSKIVVLYTIEFQKRGLLHCHSLLWINDAPKVQQDVDVDKYVYTELPDPTTDANGFAVISELMIHRPYGYANRHASCMKDSDIQKINSKIYPTNKAACQALGLLSGDKEWVTASQEAGLFATSLELRRLFVYILIFCNVSDPIKLWDKLWKDLSDDIPRKLSKTLKIPQIERNEKKFKASALFYLEHMLNACSKSLKDFGLPTPNTLFEGKSIMLGGDFRQTLPIKRKASKPEILDASITSSYLWPKFKTYTRMQYMQLHQSEITEAERVRIQNFSRWLLNIGDGTIGDPDGTDSENTFNANMPHELCIPYSDTTLASLINFIYDQMTLQTPTPKDLQKKVIVCPKNENADMIIARVLGLVNHQHHVYLSLDEAMPHGNDGGKTELLYPPEYLNSLNFAGFPPHKLELKVGAHNILLRNLNISGGLFNGTWLIVTQLIKKGIEARIITRTRMSEKVYLSRISLINRDLQLPFIFKRKQFPIKLCYAMTINKSQGQSLERIEANDPNIIPMDKGKLPLIEANTISLADINQHRVIKELKCEYIKNGL
nr:DNA helicase [Tanacetum cinerariifolium]